jgi:ketosteroid isomerase-like protein
MKAHWARCAAAVAMSVGAAPLVAQTSATRDSAALVATEHRWAEANVACDTSMMRDVLSDSLIFVHANGNVDGKRAYLIKVSGCQVAHVEIVPTSVHTLGDVAIVDGTLRLTFKGRDSGAGVTYSRVYIRSGSRWLLFAHHTTNTSLKATPIQTKGPPEHDGYP